MSREMKIEPLKRIGKVDAGNKAHALKEKPSNYVRGMEMPKTFYVVAGIYNEGDGYAELVSNALWYPTLEEARKRAEEWAHGLYYEWLEETSLSLRKKDGGDVQFDDVWEKVDNGDPEFMDWGFDPVEEWGVACVRIRVFKVTRGK